MQEVDFVLAENTKKTKFLLERYGVKNKILLFNDFSTKKKIQSLVNNISKGKNIALVSDAGTPLISDPGTNLVQAAIEEKIKVVPIPGASSLISALVASGLSADKFIFYGFLPKKKGELKKLFEEIRFETKTQIFFESPKRIKKTLSIIQEEFNLNQKIVIARELTKIYEEFYRGKVSDLSEILSNNSNNIEKGELVIIIEGSNEKYEIDNHLEEILFKELKPLLTLRQISKIISKISSKDSKEIYNFFLKK